MHLLQADALIEVRSQKFYLNIYSYTKLSTIFRYHFQALKRNENIHVKFVCMYIQEIATKTFKPLPNSHQWIKKLFLLFKFLKLTEKFFFYLYMYILNICCSALSVAEKGGGCQCNVGKTYYSKIYKRSIIRI